MQNFHSLTIKEITRETPKSVSIALDIPKDLKNEFVFEAGQYITIKANQNGDEIRRSYSICSTPKSGDLKIGVKEVEGGAFSPLANNRLKVGDTLKVFPPEGKFTLHPKPDSPTHKYYAAFAAGSGITPVLSIVKTVLEEEEHSKFVLVYGNKSPQETMFFRELLELQQKYSHRLFIEFVYSRAQEKDSFFGRIEKGTVNFILKNKFKGQRFYEFYLCGPESMTNMVKEVLQENDIPKERIHFELFTTEEEGEVEAHLEGNTEVTVMLDDEETTFEMSQKSKVLDAALEEDLDAPYSCQGGICSSCVARLVEGKVEMEKNQILTDDEIEEGLILTCQSHPTTKKIIIDYDDI